MDIKNTNIEIMNTEIMNINKLNVTLRFNDNVNIELSKTSFIYYYSNLLSFDFDEDNVIYILCPSTYIIDNGLCIFDDKTDLSFMFTLLPNKFLEVCKFLDIIEYTNKYNIFNKQFILYVMENSREDIKIIQYFMQSEIRSIMNYINNEDIDLQIKSCTHEFYFLYLIKFKEQVIKHNRYDIYELSMNKNEYYQYIRKYDNQLTYFAKQTYEYITYMDDLNAQLYTMCNMRNNINKIKELIEQGADINLYHRCGWTPLHVALTQYDNFEVVKYLVEHGADIHLQTSKNNTTLHIVSRHQDKLEIIKYLVELGIDVNLQNNTDYTALHFASCQKNNLEAVKYLVEHGVNINLQSNDNKTALDIALFYNNVEVINYLKSLY